jgi:hypothetical protein
MLPSSLFLLLLFNVLTTYSLLSPTSPPLFVSPSSLSPTTAPCDP